jgi:4-hydroxybenzoate polyprenyltransferase
VKSTALAWGDKTKQICEYLNVVITGLLAASGYVEGLNMAFYPMLGVSAWYLRGILKQLDIDNRESCNKFFENNRVYAVLVALSILLGKVNF